MRSGRRSSWSRRSRGTSGGEAQLHGDGEELDRAVELVAPGEHVLEDASSLRLEELEQVRVVVAAALELFLYLAEALLLRACVGREERHLLPIGHELRALPLELLQR